MRGAGQAGFTHTTGSQGPLSYKTKSTFPERKKETTKRQNPNEGWDEHRPPPARAGFWKDDQGHRGTGVGSASRHRCKILFRTTREKGTFRETIFEV